MGWWVAHLILVSASAHGPNPSFFFFGGTFIQLGGLFGQGLGLGLGPGLDNKNAGRYLLRSGRNVIMRNLF